MELDRALELAARDRRGILVTLKADGRPQLSNIFYALDGGIFRISVTDGRAKVANLRRDRRASLYLPGDDFFHYLVLEGEVELSATASDPDDEACDELVELYREVEGEHDDWAAYRRSMVEDRRLVLRFEARRAYGLWSD